MRLQEYLELSKGNTNFPASVSNGSGFVTFSNSGKGGAAKSFVIGLDSLITTLQDIQRNRGRFLPHASYEEKRWRSLAKDYYTDPVAGALAGVQTKGMFSTLSKLIQWANAPMLGNLDVDKQISFEPLHLTTTIDALNELSRDYAVIEVPKRISDETSTNFQLEEFLIEAKKLGWQLSEELVFRFASSLFAKRFLILTGLSGSGKTKLAQTFAQWICESPAQYCIVPVGADWTSREPLLGYANALETGQYVKPDNGALDLLLEAVKPENEQKPFFLILDEMNLSHVERYFADFLSVMESGEPLPLHAATDDWNECDVPASVKLPPNLFVIGTVNIDETTYMFSPKVLDRAGVIEFRVSADEMATFLTNPVKPNTASLAAGGAAMAADFVAKATGATPAYAEAAQLSAILLGFFGELQQVGAEFGYRSASEIARFAGMVTLLTEANPWSIDQIADAAILQKLLPKLHGSRRQLEPVLIALAGQCVSDQANIGKWLLGDAVDVGEQRFPLTLEKLGRMYRRLMQDGFTSFAEA